MQARLKQLGLTPAKGAAIVGLLLVLAVVWGPQLLKSGKASKVAKNASSSARTATSSSASKPSSRKNLRRSARTTNKKERSLPSSTRATSSVKREVSPLIASEAGVYDPFRVPDWSPFAARLARSSSSGESVSSLSGDELEVRAAALRKAGVAMVLVSSTGQIAKIGDQTVQVGDEIDGFRVIQITADGVVLKPNSSHSIDNPHNEGGR